MEAATLATERFSHADAARLYRRAIEAGRAEGGAADRRVTGRGLGAARRGAAHVGEPAAAAKALTEARRLLPDDPVAQARLCHRHAEVAERDARRWLPRCAGCMRGLRCVEASTALRRRWRARMRSLPGWHPQPSGPAERRQSSTCREAIAEAEAVGELSALAHACYALDYALVGVGPSAEATHSARALEIYERARRSRARVPRAQQPRRLSRTGTAAGTRPSSSIAARRRAPSVPGRPADVAMTDGNIGGDPLRSGPPGRGRGALPARAPRLDRDRRSAVGGLRRCVLGSPDGAPRPVSRRASPCSRRR